MLCAWNSMMVMVVLATSSRLCWAQSTSELLEKAIFQEKTAGNLDAAIEIYQKIIDQEKATRPGMAQAYYRMGLCLAKKGEVKKAAEAFRAVVANYSDVKPVVALAQKELDKITPGSAPLKVERRSVDKPIADFPEAVDLSTPESACAAIVRALAALDARRADELSWSPANPAEWKRLEAEKQSDPEGLKAFCTALTDAKVLEVAEYGPELAQVTVLLQGPADLIRNPYSARWMACIDKQWKNLGEDRLPSADAARAAFEAKKDSMRVRFANLKEQRGALSGGVKRPGMALLDQATRVEVEHFEQSFASFFGSEPAYRSASDAQKEAMVEKWMIDARSGDFNARTRAIAALGNVKAKQAVPVLQAIVDEPMGNHRPKWMAVRSLGKIGDPVAVPALIEMVDHGNVNTKVYSRWALAEITGVYFGEDKARWRQWWKERGGNVSAQQKLEAEALAAKGWKAWTGGKHEEAEKLFEQAVARDPRVANNWSGLGWAQLKQGRPKAAKVSFQKALELDPALIGALNGLGFVAKAEGNTEEAVARWKKALAASPEATAPMFGLANTYLELKKYAEAAEYFQKLLAIEPGNAEAKAGLEKAKAEGK